MVTLSLTGLLTVLLGVTLVLLVGVILQKERREDADLLDRAMLVGFGLLTAASMAYGGVLVMYGALAGLAEQELTSSILINNTLKAGAIIFGWVKIIRNVIHVATRHRKDIATLQDIDRGVKRLESHLEDEAIDRKQGKGHRGIKE